jgi:hypothetical protein
MHIAMASSNEMKLFLESTQYRACIHTQFALPDSSQAMPIVCAAMRQLVCTYPHAAPTELPLLFQRLLLSATRRAARLAKWQRLLPTLRHTLIPPREEDLTPNALEAMTIRVCAPDETLNHWLIDSEFSYVAAEALRFLPLRQRAAFLLTKWDGLTERDCARIMICSRRRIRRDSHRAQTTLELIFGQKGVKWPLSSTSNTLQTNMPECMAQVLDAALAQSHVRLANQLEPTLQTCLQEHQQHSLHTNTHWQSLRRQVVLNALMVRRAILVVALCTAGLIAIAVLPSTTVNGSDDAHLLASELPLPSLLDPHFKEALHD